MKKLLFPLVLCLCLVLTGCQGGKVRVYMDRDTVVNPSYSAIAGASWLSYGLTAVLEDNTIPDDAVLCLGTEGTPRDNDASVDSYWEGYWEGLGFTYELNPDWPQDPNAGAWEYACIHFLRKYVVSGTKAQWKQLAFSYEMSEPRAYMQGNRVTLMLCSLTPMPEDFATKYEYKASPGVLLYAEHPEKFIDPPTVEYTVSYIERYTHPSNIPALLEREEVSQIQFVGHYMVKE